jgi:hypothetical protein
VNLLFYTNCTGYGLQAIINRKYPDIQTEVFTIKSSPLLICDFNAVDVVIHHPVSWQNDLFDHLRPDCIKISYPYIYCSALWPMYLTTGNASIKGYETILALKNAGISVENAIEQYKNGTLDFQLAARYAYSIAELERREKQCDIQVCCDIIKSSIRTERLFYTKNHPTNRLYFAVANTILARLGLDAVEPYADCIQAVAEHRSPPETHLITPYAVRDLGLCYGPDEGWQEQGAELIRIIYDKR